MKYYAPYGSPDPDASYVDKDVPGAVRGSAVPAKAIEKPQREIVDFIINSGFAPGDELQLARAIQSGKVNYAVAGGTANAVTATLAPAPSSISDGMVISVLISTTNTSAPTLNVNGLGADPVVNANGQALGAGDLVAGNVVQLTRRNGQWRFNGVSRGQLLRTTMFTRVAGVQYIQVDGGAPTTTGASAFTSHPQAAKCFVEGTSAGSAGGGAAATNSSQLSFGAGGNPGAYGLIYIPGQLASIPVSLGAPGIGVSGGAGGASSATTFGSLITFPGAGGAPASIATNIASVGTLGSPSGPVTVSGPALLLKNVYGGGPASVGFIVPSLGIGSPGVGGSGPFGQNAYASGAGFGNGGGGKANGVSAGAQTGGDGGAPFIMITEYA